MTEAEKFSLLVKFQCEKSKVRITTVENAVYHCKLLGQCEDGDEYAYEFFSPDYPTKFFALDCDFIERIEAISEDEWQQHLKNKNS